MSKSPWPSMTSPELIAALDAMCTVALCSRRRKRDGEIVYSLSVDEIHEADDLLSGRFHDSAVSTSGGNDALKRMAAIPSGGGDLGEAITADILDRISARMPPIGSGADVEAVMRGVACAYVALAYAFGTPDAARDMLIGIAHRLDNPETQQEILQGVSL